MSASYLAVPITPLPSSSSSSPAPPLGCVSPLDTGSYYPGVASPPCGHVNHYPGVVSPPCGHVNHYPAPLSPDSKRRLAELSHDLSLAQKISLVSMWLLAAFYGITACFPEKVTLRTSISLSD